MAEALLFDPRYTATLFRSPLGAVVGQVGVEFDRTADYHVDGAGLLALTTGEAATHIDSANTEPAQSGGPATRLVRAYQQHGDRALTLVGGVRSGVLIDAGLHRCLVFTDRYARERVFVCRDGHLFYFASEAKAILAVVPSARRFDSDGLANVLSCGCTLSTQSLFNGIEVLEGGTLLSVEHGAVSRHRYTSPDDLESLAPMTEAEFLAEFPRTLLASVHSSTVSVARVGVSLTGGLDSRMLMACLEARPGTVPCYTFGSMHGVTRDVAIGGEVATACGQPHHALELGQAFLRDAWSLLDQAVYISDGYIGLSGAAELYVNRLARQLAPARLTGNWGGELMRGVRAFKFTVPRGGFVRRDLEARIASAATAFSERSDNPIAAALFQQMPAQGYGRYAVERSQVQILTPFLADDVVQCLWRAPATVRASIASAVAVIRRRPELLRIPTDQGQLGTASGPLAAWRRLQRRLTTKAEYMTSHGAPDWLARACSSLPEAVLETRFLGRDKFQHFRRWLRRDLAPALEATLVHSFDPELGAWFNAPQVAQMVKQHIAGHANFTDELDKILTVAVAHRCLLRGASMPVDVPSTRLRIVDVSTASAVLARANRWQVQ